MSNLIGIQVNVELAKLADTEVQGLIKDIETKLKPIKVDLDIDNKALKTIEQFNKGMKDLALSAKQTQQAVSSVTKSPLSNAYQQDLDKLAKAFPKVTEAANRMSGDTGKAFGKHTGELGELTDGYSKLISVTSKLDAEQKELQRTIKLSSLDGKNTRTVTMNRDNTTTHQDTANIEKNRVALSKIGELRSNINRQVETMLRTQRISNEEAVKYRGILERTNSIEGLRKVQASTALATDRKRTLELDHQLNKMREQAKFNVSRLTEQAVGKISPERQQSLSSDLAGMERITSQTANAKMEMDKFNSSIKRTTTEVRDADQGMARFGAQMQSAFLRIPIYAAGMALMYAPLRAFKDAIQQIIEIDTQMTVLERVSDGTIEINKAMEDSIGIAQKLGNTISDVNDGLIAFARQGFRGEDLTAITEVATVMSNVSELGIDDSASSLTAAMKGFNIEAQDSIRIVDALNEVNVNQPPCIVMCM